MSVSNLTGCQRRNDGQGHASRHGGGHGWEKAWICKYAVILGKKSSPITGLVASQLAQLMAHHAACHA